MKNAPNWLERHAWVILRLGVCLLYAWFAFSQLFDPAAWVGYLPEWTGYFPIPGEMLIRLHAWTELFGATLLALGLGTRLVAFVMGLHTAALALDFGGAVGVRDGMLALTMLMLATQQPDRYTLDAKG